MYSEIIFLYYFEDLKGALLSSVCFCAGTFLASLAAVHMSDIFYGFGVWIGSVIGFAVAYARLRCMERNLNEHMFCKGNIIRQEKGIKPSPKVFALDAQTRADGSLEIEDKEVEQSKDNEKTVIYH